MKKKSKEHVLLYKIIFSLIIMVIYICGRNISVYGVDISAYQVNSSDVQSVFLQTLSGDSKTTSIFVLGLWPYMIASMLAIVYMAIKSVDKNAKLSQNHLNIATLVIMMICALVQGWNKIRAFQYLDGYDNWLVKGVGYIEIITGMVLVVYLCDLCAKYGIGGKSAVFLVNIMDGILNMIIGKSWDEIRIPLLIGIVEGFILILLDNTEKRIPVQRVSIHNIYADKNYIAYSFATVGIMPLMFASAFFSLVQMLFAFLGRIYPEHVALGNIAARMQLTDIYGMITYIVIIWIINIAFSFIMLRPIGTAESLLKAGDSLENIYAGKKTKLYLFGCVMRLSIYSSITYSVFMAIPFALLLLGYLDSSMVLLPTSIMMTTGLWLMFYREAEVYLHYDRYKAFF